MKLNSHQEDALREIISIGVARAAASLSELIGLRIELSVPKILLIGLADLSDETLHVAAGQKIVIAQDFQGPIAGRAALVFPHASGVRLAQTLGGVENPADDLDLELSGILSEAANIILNGILGSLADVLESYLSFSMPWFTGEQRGQILPALCGSRFNFQQQVVVADAEFQVRQHALRCLIVVIFEWDGLKKLLQVVRTLDSTV